jgi:hypothetical protein
VSEFPSTDILVRAARELARMGDLRPFLDSILSGLAASTGAGSAAVFAGDTAHGELRIVASLGLGEDAEAGLAAAVRNPAHAVARTFANGETGFDVLPAAPGGPALRSHLPLIVRRDGAEKVIGVLALAHDRPIESGFRPVLSATADLAAVAIDRSHP